MTEADASEKRQREFVERSEHVPGTSSTSTRRSPSCWSPKASARSKRSPMSRPRSLPRSRASTRSSPPSCRTAPQEALERREDAAREERRALGVEDALAELPYLTEAMLVTLGKAGIKTLDDLADLATDELVAEEAARAAPPAPRATGPRTRAACSPNMASATSRATRSSWPPAPTGSRTRPKAGEDAVAESSQ